MADLGFASEDRRRKIEFGGVGLYEWSLAKLGLERGDRWRKVDFCSARRKAKFERFERQIERVGDRESGKAATC